MPGMSETDRTDKMQKLAELIDGIDVCMMTTNDDGTFRSRPMWNKAHKSDIAAGTLYFFTKKSDAKVSEITDDRDLNCAFSDPSGDRYVSVSGHARVTTDNALAERLWDPTLKSWFPDGPTSPEVAILRVDIDAAEYWDAPDSTMIHLWGMAKAAITGEPAQPGGNEKVGSV
jgi:general stress protein 26